MDRDEQSAVELTARRRLIRGVFATPAVLTVASGSAMAASNIRCIQSVKTFPAVYSGTTPPSTDTIIRIRVYKYGSLRCVRYQDVPTAYASNAGAGFMGSGQVWEFDVTNNRTLGSPRDTPNSAALALDKWAALRFDATGKLVGVGAASDGWAITGSCWNSFG
jgi:hypothetical protein